ncbi:MAG: hypothetical protein IT529_08775 [Burkholderiales bacterium]|nr:hypothetical protein [Burkholderiales bacterium]
MRYLIRRLRGLLVLAGLAAGAGCQSIGPGSIHRDRIDYAGAIADSWKQQTLLNIIRLRYFDTPTFLDVASVISSYQLQGEVRAGTEIFPNAAADTNRSLGVAGTFIDRPTVSYAPLAGEKFVNSLLRPIPPQAVFAMIVAGHQADFIFQASVRAVNDVYNHTGSPGRARREDAQFSRVTAALRRIQQAGALGMRVERRVDARGAGGRAAGARESAGEPRPGAEESWIFFRERVDEATDADIRLVKQVLGIRPDARELRLVFGSLRRREDEIALLTRSIMEILVELSAGIEVPDLHVAEGRVRPMMEIAPATGERASPMVRIRSGEGPPGDAYAAVRYRNLWFWVDDRDLASKRTFTFLRMFSSIAETGVAPQVPILTIPAN